MAPINTLGGKLNESGISQDSPCLSAKMVKDVDLDRMFSEIE